jgi:hypothetical protein
MEEHITLEMMLYGATSFGGSITYISETIKTLAQSVGNYSAY